VKAGQVELRTLRVQEARVRQGGTVLKILRKFPKNYSFFIKQSKEISGFLMFFNRDFSRWFVY
jgi:TnpA family transposase